MIPYLPFYILKRKYFDDVIYAEGIEKYNFKAAILTRNKYSVKNSAHAICYIAFFIYFSFSKANPNKQNPK